MPLKRLDSLSAAERIRLLWRFFAAAVVLSLAQETLFFLAGRDTEFQAYGRMLSLTAHTDSWRPIYEAVAHFLSGDEGGIYETIFEQRRIKFQYPPTSLLPFAALQKLGLDREGLYALMAAVNLAAVAATAWAIGRLWLAFAAPAAGAKAFAGVDYRVAAYAVAALVTFGFYPINAAYSLGQIQAWINLAVALAVLAWLRGAKGGAGALMAFAALIKPQYALVLIWALLRREFGFVKAFLIVAAPVGLLSLAVFGVGEHLDYLAVLSQMSRVGETYWHNQSMNGLLNRLFENGPPEFTPTSFPPFHPAVYAGTLLSSAALIVAALWFRPRWARAPGAAADRSADERLLDFCFMIMALTLASPIAWEHHFGVFLPVFALLFGWSLRFAADRFDRCAQIAALALFASYFVVANYFSSLGGFFDRAPQNLLQSYHYFAALAALAATAWTRMRIGGGAPTA